MDQRVDRDIDDAPPMPSEAELIAVLEQSARDRAAGRLYPIEDVFRELDEALLRIEASRKKSGA